MTPRLILGRLAFRGSRHGNVPSLNEGLPVALRTRISLFTTASPGGSITPSSHLKSGSEIFLSARPELRVAVGFAANRTEAIQLQLVTLFTALGRPLGAFAKHWLQYEWLLSGHREDR
jgi:hypothetical protein